MKKLKTAFLSALLVCIMLSGVISVPVYAANGQGEGQGRTDSVNSNDYSTNNWDRISYNYQFTSGPNTNATFGSPTQTDKQGSNPLQDNVQRNKDSSNLPPGYGIFSGAIPTNPSNPYYAAASTASASNATYNGTASVNYYGETTGVLPSTSTMQTPGTAVNGATTTTASGVTASNITITPVSTNNTLTQPTYYDDGSIGKLSIPAINTYIKVYEGESAANMKLGAAHFESTSAWDGNVGLAGHNRGASDYFKGVKDLRIGDLITYETQYGTRTYRVYLKEIISDTDYSYLTWSQNNVLTLITCVIDTPDKRWVVQAIEVR